MQGEMEDFKRPNHPDFMDSSELKKLNWSGFRHNSLTNEAEIWILGEVKRTISEAEVLLNPLAINKAYEEVFALAEVMPDTQAARDYVRIRDGGK